MADLDLISGVAVPLLAARRRADIMTSFEVADDAGVFVVAELRGVAGREYALACGCGRVALKAAWACEHIRAALDAVAAADAAELARYRARNAARAARRGLSLADYASAALADLGEASR